MAEYEAQNVILKDKNGKYLIPFVGDKANRDLANTGMITNCLTKVPQRIKYTLDNGTLTIKAGSVVIVPYGTENLVATSIDDVYTKITEYSRTKYWYIKKTDADVFFTEYVSKQGLTLYKVNDDNSVGEIDEAVTMYNATQGVVYKDTKEPVSGYDVEFFKEKTYKKDGTEAKFNTYFHIPNTIYYFGTKNMEFDGDNDLSIFNEVFTFDGEKYNRLQGYIGFYNQGWSWLRDEKGEIVFDNGGWTGQRIEVLNTDGVTIGDTFINDNFKVVDTQYDDSKFFVWAELQKDISGNLINSAYVIINLEQTSLTQIALADDMLVYENNKISYPPMQEYLFCFPIMETKNSINQVFNGIGYIGSTIWVDKGIKGLIPNYKNADGTRKSVFYETTKLVVSAEQSYTFNKIYWIIGNQEITPFDATMYQYNDGENINIDLYQNAQSLSIIIAECSLSSGKISNFKLRQPLKVANADSVDGVWVKNKVKILSDVSPSATALTVDISAYLPNDGNNYWVLLEGRSTTGSTAGNYVYIFVASSLTDGIGLSWARTRTTSAMESVGSAMIPVGADRKITISGDTSTNFKGTQRLIMHGYRKMGV